MVARREMRREMVRGCTTGFLGEGFLYDWWRYVAPVFELHNSGLDKSQVAMGYSQLLTEFAIQ